MERRRRSRAATARSDRPRGAAKVGAATDGGRAARPHASADSARQRSLLAAGQSQTDPMAEPRPFFCYGRTADAAHSLGLPAIAWLPETRERREAGLDLSCDDRRTWPDCRRSVARL